MTDQAVFYNYKYYGYDDAIYASLKLIKILNNTKKTLNELTSVYMKSFSTPEIKLYCDEKIKFSLLDKIVKDIPKHYDNSSAKLITIDGVRLETENFWFLLRASNTQNCIVFRLEHIVKDKFKELPNNIEAEQAVIGSILVSNEIFDEINIIITSNNFYDPMHQKIFGAIESLIYKGLLANPITLKNYFEDEKDELNVPEYLVKITKFS